MLFDLGFACSAVGFTPGQDQLGAQLGVLVTEHGQRDDVALVVDIAGVAGNPGSTTSRVPGEYVLGEIEDGGSDDWAGDLRGSARDASGLYLTPALSGALRSVRRRTPGRTVKAPCLRTPSVRPAAPGLRAHGHIADDVGSERGLKPRKCWSEACDSGKGSRVGRPARSRVHVA